MATTHEAQNKARTMVYWLSGTNLVVGLWLLAAPFALGYSGITEAVWNDVIVGAAIALIALMRVAAPLRFESLSWTNAVLGVWLLIAPFSLGYTDVAEPLWNDLIAGAIVIGLATWSALSVHGRQVQE